MLANGSGRRYPGKSPRSRREYRRQSAGQRHFFDAAYPGGGRDSYHPKMLTKVIIYAYTQRIYSSRQIAKAVRENIPFMWLAGRQRPDFRTLNRFRSQRMRNVLETVFTAVLQFLADEKKYVSLEHYFCGRN
ncbi:transposase [Paenibacillus rhizoplanae]